VALADSTAQPQAAKAATLTEATLVTRATKVAPAHATAQPQAAKAATLAEATLMTQATKVAPAEATAQPQAAAKAAALTEATALPRPRRWRQRGQRRNRRQQR
jgi:hypothetical protein